MAKIGSNPARKLVATTAKGGKRAIKRKLSTMRTRATTDGPAAAICDMSGRAARQGIEALKVELTPDAAQWVQAALASGRFPTAEDAVRYAINRAKRAELGEMLEAGEAEGGSYSTEDVRGHVREHLDRLKQTSPGS